jgi:hypothetical protein
MKKLLKSRKGITLVELVVALLVFSILVMSVAAVFAPMLRTYYHAVDFAETNPLLDEISNILLTDINQANSVKIVRDTVTLRETLTLTIKRAGFVEYTVLYDFQPIVGSSSTLTFLHRKVSGGANGTSEPVPVFDPDYYRGIFTQGKSVNVTYVFTDEDDDGYVDAGTSFSLNIAVQGTGGQKTSRTYAANPLCI